MEADQSSQSVPRISRPSPGDPAAFAQHKELRCHGAHSLAAGASGRQDKPSAFAPKQLPLPETCRDGAGRAPSTRAAEGG